MRCGRTRTRTADSGTGSNPDLRGPESQPVPVEVALFVMDEVGTLDDGLLDGCLRYLESITRPDGGVPWVLPTTSPRGPWWEPADDLPGSLNPTASIAGLLLKNGIEHPWLSRATDFCWQALDGLTGLSVYDVRTIIGFLEHAPDRSRADAAWASLSKAALSVVNLDPAAEGETHGPLDIAPTPRSLARPLFAAT